MNYSEKYKVLLDTTYLLPIVGIEVENLSKTLALLKKLHDSNMAIYYYTPFNIFEILGKLSKIEYDRRLVEIGLRAIEEKFKLAYPTLEGYIKALELRRKGFRDLIDLLLYTTSLDHGLLFLTRDQDLIDFLKDNNEVLDNILTEGLLFEIVSKLNIG